MTELLLYYRSSRGNRGRLLFRAWEILEKKADLDGCFVTTIHGGRFHVLSTVPESIATLTSPPAEKLNVGN